MFFLKRFLKKFFFSIDYSVCCPSLPAGGEYEGMWWWGGQLVTSFVFVAALMMRRGPSLWTFASLMSFSPLWRSSPYFTTGRAVALSSGAGSRPPTQPCTCVHKSTPRAQLAPRGTCCERTRLSAVSWSFYTYMQRHKRIVAFSRTHTHTYHSAL